MKPKETLKLIEEECYDYERSDSRIIWELAQIVLYLHKRIQNLEKEEKP